jgi:hypothetical protein
LAVALAAQLLIDVRKVEKNGSIFGQPSLARGQCYDLEKNNNVAKNEEKNGLF